MAYKFEGTFSENAVRRTVTREIFGETRKSRVPEYKDVYDRVLITDIPANTKKMEGTDELSATRYVFVRNLSQRRRITAFNTDAANMADQLMAIKPGTTVTLIGKKFPETGQSSPGFNVEEIRIVSEPSEDSVKACHVDPLAQNNYQGDNPAAHSANQNHNAEASSEELPA